MSARSRERAASWARFSLRPAPGRRIQRIIDRLRQVTNQEVLSQFIHQAAEAPIQTTEERTLKEKITKGSGNVFIDLGFPPEDAMVLAMRSQLMCDPELLIALAARAGKQVKLQMA